MKEVDQVLSLLIHNSNTRWCYHGNENKLSDVVWILCLRMILDGHDVEFARPYQDNEGTSIVFSIHRHALLVWDSYDTLRGQVAEYSSFEKDDVKRRGLHSCVNWMLFHYFRYFSWFAADLYSGL